MIRLISLLAIVTTLAISCRPLKDPVFNGIENVRVNEVGLEESSITLDMSYTNLNDFRARLKSAEGDAWIDSTYLGHFVLDTTVAIPRSSNFLVPVNLSVNMKKLLKNSFAALLNKHVLIRIKGTGKAGRNGVYRNFKINYEGKQDLSKLFSNF